MNFISVLLDNFKSFAVLKIAVNPNKPDLVDMYKKHIQMHNASIITDPFPNSGFDLFVPDTTEIVSNDFAAKMVSMDVKCEMMNKSGSSSAFYMFPRSSFSKTPLLLANHTGIIDSGYRGFLISAFRNLSLNPYTVEKGSRLMQICHPSLCPIHVIMVDEIELSTTSRGEGGFGSTGI